MERDRDRDVGETMKETGRTYLPLVTTMMMTVILAKTKTRKTSPYKRKRDKDRDRNRDFGNKVKGTGTAYLLLVTTIKMTVALPKTETI